MNRLIKLLLLEDSADDTQLLLLQLKQDGIEADWQRVETEADFRAGLDSQPDLILADYSLPSYTGIKALELVNELGLDIPFILVSGTMGEETAVNAIKKGAADYLLKDRLARLGEAVNHALEQKRLREEKAKSEEALRASEDRYRDLIENSQDLICTHDLEGVILSANPASARLLGYDVNELIGSNLRDHLAPEVRGHFKYYINRLKRNNSASGILIAQTKDGERRVWEYQNTVRTEGVAKPLVRGMARDVTERRRAEAALQEAEIKYRMLVERLPVIVYTSELGMNGAWPYVSPQIEQLLGFTQQEWMADSELWYRQVHPEDRDRQELLEEQADARGEPFVGEYRIFTHDGRQVWIRDSAHILPATQSNGAPIVQGILMDITERKQADEALRISETRFRALIERNADLIIVIDTEGVIQFVSPSAERILGYSLTETVGRNFLEWIHPDDMALALKSLASRREVPGPAPAVIELRSLHKNGTWRTVDVLGTNLLAEPAVQGIVLNVRDITERKLAEEKLAASENELRALFASMQDVVMTIDRDGIYRKIAPTQPGMLYKPPQELLGKSLADVFPQAEADQFVSITREVLATGKSQQIEYQLRIGETLHWFLTNITPMSADLTVWVAHDITERKRAEDEISRLKEFNENLINNMSEGIGVQNTEGSFTFVNPAISAITGYLPEELIGGHWTKFIPADQHEIIKESDNRRLAGESSQYEIDFLHKSGQRIKMLISGSPLFENGRFNGTLAVFTDISERKRTEEQMLRRLTELEVLYESGLALSRLSSPKEIGQKIISLLDQKMDWHHTAIRQYHPEDDTLELLAFNQQDLISEQEKIAVEERLRTIVAKKGQGLSGWVIEHGQGVRTSALNNDTRYVDTYPGLLSGLYVPIKSGERVIGVISIESEKEDAFTESDERLTVTLANQAASALENARLFHETQRRLRQTLALREIDQAIAGSMHLQYVLDVVLKHVMTELGVDAAVILLNDPHEQVLKYELGKGLRTNALQSSRLRLGDGYAGQAALGRQTVYVPNLQTRTTDFLRSPTFSREGFVCYFGVPLIAKGKINGVLEIFHRSAFKPRPEWLDFMETLAGQIAIAIDNATLYKDLQHSNIELFMAYDATIEGWSHALDLRDKETEGHTQRVTELTMKLARAMSIPEADLIHIRRGALLHDIGKMGVPDSILHKPGALTDEEWVIMRQHPTHAYEMLSSVEYLNPALDIPYCHHEKWDGTGYPRGLKGEQIPFTARIFAVADVYDALTSDRPYRSGWSKEKTLDYLRTEAGKHFDSEIVKAFLNLIADQ